MFAIFVERGRADTVQLPAGEHGLEQVARVHRALGLAGPDDRVQLVDEKNDAPVALFDLGEHGFQALLKFAAVFRTRHERPHVERENRLVLEPLRHVAAHDALGEPLDDGRLADARLADEHRIVLRLARQNADRAPDLVIAADDRIHFPFPGLRHQIDPVFLQRGVGRLGIVGRHALRPAHLFQHREHLRPVEAETLELLLERGGFRDVEQTEQQMLDGHKIILQRFGLLFAAGEHLVDGLRHVDLRGVDAARDLRNALQLPFDGELYGGRRDRQLVEEPGHDAVLLRHEGGNQVPRIDLGMIEPAGDVLRIRHRLTRHLGKFGEVHGGSTVAQTGPVGDGVFSRRWATVGATSPCHGATGRDTHPGQSCTTRRRDLAGFSPGGRALPSPARGVPSGPAGGHRGRRPQDHVSLGRAMSAPQAGLQVRPPRRQVADPVGRFPYRGGSGDSPAPGRRRNGVVAAGRDFSIRPSDAPLQPRPDPIPLKIRLPIRQRTSIVSRHPNDNPPDTSPFLDPRDRRNGRLRPACPAR